MSDTMPEPETYPLPKEADAITPQLVKELMTSYLGRDDVVVDKFSVGTPIKPGDNYLSVVLSTDIDYHIQGEQEGKIESLVVKVEVQKLPELREFSRRCKFFDKEIDGYSRLFPALIKVAKEHGLNDIMLPFPRYYYNVITEDNEMLFMENLVTSGYVITHNREGISVERCKKVMEAFAHFTGLAYVLNAEEGCIKDPSRYPLLQLENESYLSPAFMDTNKRFHSLSLKIDAELFKKNVPAEELTEETLKRIEALSNLDYPEKMMSYLMPESPYSTACHGDMSGRNSMFLLDENGLTKDVRFVDFQFLRVAVPTTDLAMFIYQMTTPDWRAQHLDELLDTYYDTLMEVLAACKTELPGYTREVFRDLWEKTRGFGILYSLALCPILLQDKEDAVDFLHIPDEKVYIDHLCKMFSNEAKKNRMLGLVYDALDCKMV